MQRAAVVAHGDGGVEPAVPQPQVVQHAQGAAGEPAQFGVVSLSSSSLITTSGSTTLCSANLVIDQGSESSTEVSST
ncbi:hypothetical protein GCM10029964_007630 [Kibdelosporangium lantanae]